MKKVFLGKLGLVTILIGGVYSLVNAGESAKPNSESEEKHQQQRPSARKNLFTTLMQRELGNGRIPVKRVSGDVFVVPNLACRQKDTSLGSRYLETYTSTTLPLGISPTAIFVQVWATSSTSDNWSAHGHEELHPWRFPSLLPASLFNGKHEDDTENDTVEFYSLIKPNTKQQRETRIAHVTLQLSQLKYRYRDQGPLQVAIEKRRQNLINHENRPPTPPSP